MKKYKKLMAVILSVVMAMGLVACGTANTDNGGNNADSSDKAVDEPTKNDTKTAAESGDAITFWYMGDGSTEIEPLISKFTEETGIEVNIQSVPWGSLSEKLLTAISSQSGPDVMQTAVSRTAQLVDANAIIDMTDYIDSTDTFSKDKFFDASYESLKIGEKYYGVPWIADVSLLFYRTDLFEKAGYSEFPKTWDEFYNACKKVSEITGKYGYEIIGANDYNFLFCYPLQSGSEMITEDREPVFNQKEFVEAMEYLNSFYEAGTANRIFDNVDRQSKLASGEIASCMGGTWLIPLIEEIPELEGKWGVSTWPQGPATNDSVYAGSNLVITSWNKNTDACVKLIEYLSRPENQLAYFKQTSSLPAGKEAWENTELKGDKILAVFREQLDHARQFPKVPEIEEIAIDSTKYFERISLGSEDVQKVMDEFNEHVKEILTRDSE